MGSGFRHVVTVIMFATLLPNETAHISLTTPTTQCNKSIDTCFTLFKTTMTNS